jgi:hypothetical protein
VKFNRSVIQLALLPILLACLIATSAFGQTSITFVPALTTSSVYDDNLFAEQRGSAGQMLQIRPSFEGNWESPRLTFLSLYSFDAIRSNHGDLNTLDARRHALVDTRFRHSPFTTFGITARYDRTETPGELEIETGFLGERRTAERWQVTPGFTRRFGPHLIVNGNYDLTTENLVDTPSGTLQAARVGLGKEISGHTTVGGAYLARHFEDPSDSHLSQSLLVTWDRELGPGTRLSFMAGPRVSTYTGLSPEISGTYGRITPGINIGLNYWHGETIILGLAGPVKMNGGMGRVTWPVTYRIDFGVHAGITDIKTLDEREARVYRSTLVGSWTRGMYSVTADYGLDYQQGDIRRRLDGDVLRHVFRLSLTVAPRLNRSILPPEEAARVKGVSR